MRWQSAAELTPDEAPLERGDRLAAYVVRRGGNDNAAIDLAKAWQRLRANETPSQASVLHAERTTKAFHPLGGECVCEYCRKLPWHLPRV